MRNRWCALAVLCSGALMIVIDATIVNVALPSIQRDLHFSQSDLAWIVNAYLIAFGGLLLLAGRLGDLIGARRVFLIGLGVFTAASVACALSQTQTQLIAARLLQGIGGAMSSAVVLGMVVTLFPDPREQAKALGIYGCVASTGGSIGLLAGGVLTQAIGWHWIFVVNVPIGIATGLLALRYVEPRPPLAAGTKPDVPGAALLTGALMIGVYAILQVGQNGWGSARTLELGLASIAALAAFVWRQAHVPVPLMPLRLFRSRGVICANVVIALEVVGMFGMFFLGALYLQRVLGYDSLDVGLAFLPMTFTMAAMSLGLAGRLMLRYGPRAMLIVSLSCAVAGLALLARVPVDGRYLTDVLPALALTGVGTGLGFPTLMTLAMSGVAPEDSGLASGLLNTSMQVGGAIGLAVLATLASQRTARLQVTGVPARAALTAGYHLAYLTGAAVVGVALLTAILLLRPTVSRATRRPVVRLRPRRSGAAR
jgi:EmrB/QacA subfamily drug resistance transporter